MFQKKNLLKFSKNSFNENLVVTYFYACLPTEKQSLTVLSFFFYPIETNLRVIQAGGLLGMLRQWRQFKPTDKLNTSLQIQVSHSHASTQIP